MSKNSEPRSLNTLGKVHNSLVLGRRLRVLASHLGSLMPTQGTVLDVGCGGGVISSLIMDSRSGLTIEGIDVLARPTCAIPMQVYDGERYPYPDNSFDVVMFTDVLHHTPDPVALLEEAARVARRAILIKDHLCDSAMAKRILSFMDWVGNRPHGVVLPYNYLSTDQWNSAWERLGTHPDAYLTNLGLYPWFARPVFERGLHFICRLPIDSGSSGLAD